MFNPNPYVQLVLHPSILLLCSTPHLRSHLPHCIPLLLSFHPTLHLVKKPDTQHMARSPVE
nr:hypothetical protein [Cressdnaviricota sp.]